MFYISFSIMLLFRFIYNIYSSFERIIKVKNKNNDDGSSMKLEQRNLERSKYVAERCSVGSSRESAGV